MDDSLLRCCLSCSCTILMNIALAPVSLCVQLHYHFLQILLYSRCPLPVVTAIFLPLFLNKPRIFRGWVGYRYLILSTLITCGSMH